MTLYALRPDPATGSLDDAEVVDEFKYGWQFLEQAITLWRLVDKDRADQIKAIKDRAARSAPEESRSYTEDLTTERSLKSKTNALGEVMSNTISIRKFCQML